MIFFHKLFKHVIFLWNMYDSFFLQQNTLTPAKVVHWNNQTIFPLPSLPNSQVITNRHQRACSHAHKCTALWVRTVALLTLTNSTTLFRLKNRSSGVLFFFSLLAHPTICKLSVHFDGRNEKITPACGRAWIQIQTRRESEWFYEVEMFGARAIRAVRKWMHARDNKSGYYMCNKSAGFMWARARVTSIFVNLIGYQSSRAWRLFKFACLKCRKGRDWNIKQNSSRRWKWWLTFHI